jgi:hypothetical protein
MEKKETVLAKGFYFDKPREGAPDFVKGKLSVKVAEAVELLKKYENNAGYVNLDLLKSKEGKLYFTVNTWQPEKKDEIEAADVPF